MKGFYNVALLCAVTLNAVDTVVDPETGLMWQDNKAVTQNGCTWRAAIRYCEDLSLGGYDDWRLPIIDELMSITDVSRYDPAIKPIFRQVKSHYYWSASEVVNSSSAWSVYVDGGGGSWVDESGENYVRCVRE